MPISRSGAVAPAFLRHRREQCLLPFAPVSLASGVSKSQRCMTFRSEHVPAGFMNTLVLFSPNMPRGGGGGRERLELNMLMYADRI